MKAIKDFIILGTFLLACSVWMVYVMGGNVLNLLRIVWPYVLVGILASGLGLNHVIKKFDLNA